MISILGLSWNFIGLPLLANPVAKTKHYWPGDKFSDWKEPYMACKP